MTPSQIIKCLIHQFYYDKYPGPIHHHSIFESLGQMTTWKTDLELLHSPFLVDTSCHITRTPRVSYSTRNLKAWATPLGKPFTSQNIGILRRGIVIGYSFQAHMWEKFNAKLATRAPKWWCHFWNEAMVFIESRVFIDMEWRHTGQLRMGWRIRNWHCFLIPWQHTPGYPMTHQTDDLCTGK